MRRLAIFIGGILLSLNVYAGDLGAGLSFRGNMFTTQDSLPSASLSKNELTVTATGVWEIQDGWELDTSLGLTKTTWDDPKSLSSVVFGPSGTYTDGLIRTGYTLGLVANKAIYANGPLKVLLGLGASGTLAGENKQENSGTYSEYDLSVEAPLTVEYLVSPQFAFRLSELLGYLAYTNIQYAYPASTITTTNLNFGFVQLAFVVGAYYFF